MWETIKNDPILKAVTVVVLSIITLGLIFTLFGGIFGHGAMGLGLGLSGILTFLLKLLLFVSIVGLVVGVLMFISQNYSKQINEKFGAFKADSKTSADCPRCLAKVTDGFKFCPCCGEKLKAECGSCGAELKVEWKCCPNCGAEKV